MPHLNAFFSHHQEQSLTGVRSGGGRVNGTAGQDRVMRQFASGKASAARSGTQAPWVAEQLDALIQARTMRARLASPERFVRVCADNPHFTPCLASGILCVEYAMGKPRELAPVLDRALTHRKLAEHACAPTPSCPMHQLQSSHLTCNRKEQFAWHGLSSSTSACLASARFGFRFGPLSCSRFAPNRPRRARLPPCHGLTK